ncbi:dialkylresorcinol condensing enzyme DarA [Chryseobacterium suipulveris]|uniref:Dialkylresorcinol condensing enzyme DarA n=1 Tax=Chryseobacterium suipulveris TaxID=2929800 RepID=A0ABY4BNQ4_9FLAO|nr:dialkylrecorsinol condensing enzyme DarA [Chryseobacterium suipulveris]UOE40822.1 dialkylresorcinol condensing enzyme DarA [Chryseobacterium suipulveris]
MAKNILVTYYSQTGQLEEIVKNVTKALAEKKEEFNVVYYEIKLKNDFEFPWKSEVFYDTFPESYLQVPREILPPPEEVLNTKFDLVIFGYQVWFLTPSIPVISFLKSEYAEKILSNTKLITVSGTRNMWMLSQEKLKVYFRKLNMQLVGNIALVDRHDNYTSVITILNWMQTGKKEQPKPLPSAGVDDKEIAASTKYGTIILPYAEKENYDGMQQELVKNGAVEVRPFLLKVETVGNKLFTVFSKLIKNNPHKRKFWVSVYKFYLFFAIWIVSPIVLFFFTILTPFFWNKRQKQIKHFQGI